MDQHVFQLDNQFQHYRQAKLSARGESLQKYYPPHNLPQPQQGLIANFIRQQLIQTYPHYFQYREQQQEYCLNCTLTGDILVFDRQGNYIHNAAAIPEAHSYIDAIDALSCQIQEDLCIVQIEGDQHWLAALHLCMPNHWAASEKIGGDFAMVHAAVPEMTKVVDQAPSLMSTLLENGPYVRFAWGLATDDRLNHHPVAPPNTATADWLGRKFKPMEPKLFLRVERQVLLGFSYAGMLLFTIRTFITPINKTHMREGETELLLKAINGMSDATLSYKGICQDQTAIMDYLRTISPKPQT